MKPKKALKNRSEKVNIFIPQTPGGGFVGYESLIKKHTTQIKKFRHWKKKGNWEMFHSKHYDWWAFPINEDSQYELSFESISKLKENPKFMKNYILGLELLFESYGYDINEEKFIKKGKKKAQQWNRRPVRLFKAGLSCMLLYPELFPKIKNFALKLKNKKVGLVYYTGYLKKNANLLERWDLYEQYLLNKNEKSTVKKQ